MPNYQKMYYILCDAASRAIDVSPEEAKLILQRALDDAEELYLRAGENSETQ